MKNRQQTAIFVGHGYAQFFDRGMVVELVDNGPGVVTDIDGCTLYVAKLTPFELRRFERLKPWIGRRYEYPATQRRRMERDRRRSASST